MNRTAANCENTPKLIWNFVQAENSNTMSQTTLSFTSGHVQTLFSTTVYIKSTFDYLNPLYFYLYVCAELWRKSRCFQFLKIILNP